MLTGSLVLANNDHKVPKIVIIKPIFSQVLRNFDAMLSEMVTAEHERIGVNLKKYVQVCKSTMFC